MPQPTLPLSSSSSLPERKHGLHIIGIRYPGISWRGLTTHNGQNGTHLEEEPAVHHVGPSQAERRDDLPAVEPPAHA